MAGSWEGTESGQQANTCCSFPRRSGVAAARGCRCDSPGAACLEAALQQHNLLPPKGGPAQVPLSPQGVTRHLQQHPPSAVAVLPQLQWCLPFLGVHTPKPTWETLGWWAPNRECTKALMVSHNKVGAIPGTAHFLRNQGMAQLQA